MDDRKARRTPGGTEAQAAIGRALKAFYDGVATEPIPDRLRDLVEELDKRHRAEEGSKPGPDGKD